MSTTNFVVVILIINSIVDVISVKSSKCSFLIMMDAGSTKTKAYLYDFAKGVSYPTVEHKSNIKPALSYYENKFGEFKQMQAHLINFLNFCAGKILPNCKAQTKVILKSTAGVRQLPKDIRNKIMEKVKDTLKQSGFRFLDDYASVLSGEDEAVYSWIALNILTGKLSESSLDKNALGMMDLGGSSTQIAFDCQNILCHQYSIFRQKIKLYTSSMPLGLNKARMRFFKVSNLCLQKGDCEDQTYESVCMNENHTGKFKHGNIEFQVQGKQLPKGKNRYEHCLKLAENIVLSVKAIPVAKKQFVMLSGFFYVIDNAFYIMKQLSKENSAKYGVEEKYQEKERYELSLKDLKKIASYICDNPPLNIQNKSYLAYNCIDLAYIIALLEKGYNIKTDTKLSITIKIGGTTIGWPLGIAMKYYSYSDNSSRSMHSSIYHYISQIVLYIIWRMKMFY